MTLNEVYVTKMCHDLAGTIGTLGNTVELFEIDPSFVKEGTSLLKNSARVLSARLKFFRALLGLDTEITTKIGDEYLKTTAPLFTINGVVSTRLQLAFLLLASEILIRGGVITLLPDGMKCSGDKILLDAEKRAVLLGQMQILKPQYMAVLWICDYLSHQKQTVSIDQTDDAIIFRIIPLGD